MLLAFLPFIVGLGLLLFLQGVPEQSEIQIRHKVDQSRLLGHPCHLLLDGPLPILE